MDELEMGSSFQEWFKKLTQHNSPRDWQVSLASEAIARSRLIRIPTGFGKTEGVLSAWSYHRIRRSDDTWPRRLVWCLPMRVLVEQTREVAQALATRINESQDEANHVSVHVVMGGESSSDWFLYPERPAIVIGTQDMLLSRALNRGYASSRARWPVDFGLLNQDALWVMDELQLMDVGLATSAQLQAFRDDDQQAGRSSKSCVTWWMSATLQPDWLKSVDTQSRHAAWISQPCIVPEGQRTGGLFKVKKTLTLTEFGQSAADTNRFAEFITVQHSKLDAGEHGRVTLVVCNTVDRACQTFAAIKARTANQQVELVHSRFRPADRQRWRKDFLCREACKPDVDRIIIATQVVEAGVDISAGLLITELAPWPSLVQRFGRCARYCGSGQVIVVDRGREEKFAPPYELEELESAWEAIGRLKDVGLCRLEEFEESLDADQRRRLYPYDPPHLLMRSEFGELFETTADLTGADLDISRFIRSGEERDLQVFWVELIKDEQPDPKRRAHREELCSIPFLKARDWLCGKETKTARKPKLLSRMRAWVWDWIDGGWKIAQRSDLLPGRIVCVAARCGGYRIDQGFDADSTQSVNEIQPAPLPEVVREASDSDGQEASDELSFSTWKTIATHTREVMDALTEISSALSLDSDLVKVLTMAAQWHDIGKAHPAFQNMLRRGRDDAAPYADTLLAKSAPGVKRRPRYFADQESIDERVGFRHELASALALFAILEAHDPAHPALLGEWSQWLTEPARAAGFPLNASQESAQIPGSPLPASGTGAGDEGALQDLFNCAPEAFDLLVYLVASHHGKVRGALYASPGDQDYVDRLGDGRGLPIRGVREKDELPPIPCCDELPGLPTLRLTLEPAAMGLSTRTGRSWRERSLDLVERLGPAQLAYLEAVLRAADVRASQLTLPDPFLQMEAKV